MTQFVLAVVLGTLFAIGTFLTLRRDVVRVIWGVTILSQTANVYLITMGGLGGAAPLLTHGTVPDPATVTDPLVQALVLTAIVIGFATSALALVLTYRIYQEHGTIDLRSVAEAETSAGTGLATDGGEAADDGGEHA
ncbi:NADH-ubiquinone oxidoreductase chain 4L [halophilic archaeon DL31]|jgi:multicomponent Na+:H+ antiporter subunit C|nr:NADH-ubiquinone oxidoreductase chain 4L [halophilic archaeon DL31]